MYGPCWRYYNYPGISACLSLSKQGDVGEMHTLSPEPRVLERHQILSLCLCQILNNISDTSCCCRIQKDLLSDSSRTGRGVLLFHPSDTTRASDMLTALMFCKGIMFSSNVDCYWMSMALYTPVPKALCGEGACSLPVRITECCHIFCYHLNSALFD